MNGNNEEWVSKTQMKKRMDELQDLGMELTRLSDETLKKIGLPEDLMQAVRDYKKITSNGALKRQNQYIGRLMRETDPAPIRAFLAKLKGENRAHNAFLQRVEQMRERLIADDAALTEFAAAHPQAKIAVIPQTPVRDAAHAQQFLRQIEAQGGEGVMLRNPNIPYQGGRSDNLLKLKSAHDAECTVTAHHEGKGRNAGLLGAVSCRNETGEFRIGSGFKDADRRNPPPIGSRITYKYRGFTAKGTPRFATYLRRAN